jgi:hypothetical protein
MKIQKIAMEYITCQVSACGKKYKRNNSFVWQTCYSAVVDTSRNGGGGGEFRLPLYDQFLLLEILVFTLFAFR